MASSLNRIQIIGNLTRDPEVRQTNNGLTVATISVATNYKWTNQQTGQPQEEVEFHSVVVWRKLAEICGQYLKKGSKVYFDGRLKTRNWTDDAGVKHYRTEIIADNMIMLDRKGDIPASNSSSSSSSNPEFNNSSFETSAPAKSNKPNSEEEINVEDLPF